MNETYEWLYDNYALPLMRVREDADEIKQAIIAQCDPIDRISLSDQLSQLCFVWGTDAFSLGLQLGLRLMAGQRAEGLAIES